MARLGLLNSNERKKETAKKFCAKRQALKDKIYDRSASLEERFRASLKLAKLPRNSSKTRIRNRCVETGRPRGVYSFCGLSRVILRENAVRGLMPGVRRSSW